MKKLHFPTFVFLLALVACMVGLNLSTVQAQQKPIEISLSHVWPPSAAQHAFFEQYAKRIETGTNGRVKIVIYPANMLCPPPEVWNGIKSGAVGIGSAFSNYHRSGFEFNNISIFLWSGAPSAEFGAKYAGKFREKYPALKKEFDGAKILWFSATAPTQLMTAKKAVRTTQDLKKLVIRPTSADDAEMLRAFGAITPAFMPISDVYTSLQKGIIAGLFNPLEVLQQFRLAEVVKYVTPMNVGFGQKYVAMNWEIWNKLPPDIQKVFETESAWAAAEDIKLWTKTEQDAKEFAKARGVEFIDLPPKEYDKVMAVVKALQDSIAKTWDAKGYPASALLRDIRDAIQVGK